MIGSTDRLTLIKRHTLLIISWINNMMKNQINDEILMLLCKTDFNKTDLVEKLNMEVSIYSPNYEILDIRDLTSINEIDRNCIKTNTIILTNSQMEADKFIDCNSILLFFEFKIFKQLLLAREKNRSEEKPTINIENRYIHYLEKRDPIKLISQYNAESIRNQILSFWDKCIFHPKYSLLQRDIYEFTKYNHNAHLIYELQDYDIRLLVNEKILTSQLAIVIYKSSTLRFDDSDTKIGNYYRKKFGIQSKATHIPLSEPAKKVKAYHLKNWNA